MDIRTRSVVAGAWMLATLALGAAAPAALAQDDAPVTLRLAVADENGRPSQPAVDAFVEAAVELSGGSLTIDPVFDAGRDTPRGFEEGTATLLMDGAFDLALVASRAWPPVGVDSLTAIEAPFLIDDDALAVAVAKSHVASEMLDDLASYGLVGLAIWPEDLRHPVAIGECVPPLTTPEAFDGLRVRTTSSGLTSDLIRAMGGTPVPEYEGGCGVPIGESGLRQGQSLPGPGRPTFTGDVTFFTKYQVLAANAASFERLSEARRGIVREAAARAQDQVIAARPSDREAAEAWCDQGGQVVLAGPDGVASFREAAQPIYDALAADPKAAAAVEAIEVLKESLEPAGGAIACGAPWAPEAIVSPATGPTPIDGTYVKHITFEELASSPLLYDQGEVNDGNWGDFSVTFDAGTFTITIANPREHYESSGPYDVEGDLLTLYDPNACCPPEPFSFRWSLDGDTLTLTRDPEYVAPTPLVLGPWTMVAMGERPVAGMPAVPADGTWRIDVTREAMTAAGFPPDAVDDVAGVYTWTFAGSGDGATGTYVLTGDSPVWGTFTCDGEYELRDDGSLMVRHLTVPNCGGAEMLWTWAEDPEGQGTVRVLDTLGWDVTTDRAMWQSARFVKID